MSIVDDYLNAEFFERILLFLHYPSLYDLIIEDDKIIKTDIALRCYEGNIQDKDLGFGKNLFNCDIYIRDGSEDFNIISNFVPRFRGSLKILKEFSKSHNVVKYVEHTDDDGVFWAEPPHTEYRTIVNAKDFFKFWYIYRLFFILNTNYVVVDVVDAYYRKKKFFVGLKEIISATISWDLDYRSRSPPTIYTVFHISEANLLTAKCQKREDF